MKAYIIYRHKTKKTNCELVEFQEKRGKRPYCWFQEWKDLNLQRDLDIQIHEAQG